MSALGVQPLGQHRAMGRDHAREPPCGRCGGARSSPAAGRRVEPRVLGQHRLLQASQGGSGLQPEVGGQAAVHAAVGLQRVQLAACRVQRVHEQLGQPLAVRMLVQQALQLPDRRRVTSEGKVGLHARLDRSKAQFLQPVRLAARERGNAELSQRNAAPQRECLAQPPRGGLRIAGLQRRTAVGGERLEAREVELGTAEAQLVAARARQQLRPRRQPRPQQRHVALQRLARRRRDALTPEVVDQPVGRQDLARMEQEDRQQRARLGPFQRQRPIAADRLERSQYPELHRCGDHLSRAFHRQAPPPYRRATAQAQAPRRAPDTDRCHPTPKEPTVEIGRIERNPDAPDEGSPIRAGRDLEREAAERLEEIRQHHLDVYAKRDVITQTTTPSGQELDWIPAESQVSGPLPEPPEIEPPEPPTDPARQARPMPFELTAPDAQVGPPGTVPVLRKPVEQIRPVGDLQDYLSKGPRRKALTPAGRPGPRRAERAAPRHKYATTLPVRHLLRHRGDHQHLEAVRPVVERVLARPAVARARQRERTADARGRRADVPRPLRRLVARTCSSSTRRTTTRTWGTTSAATTPTSAAGTRSRVVFPGMRVAESLFGGDQFDLALKVTLSQGNWWVRVGDEWMGCYPSTLFNAAGLRDRAEILDWGGEIVDDVAFHPEPSATWMGSGRFPFEGWQRASYMRNLALQADAAGTMAGYQGFVSATNPSAYQINHDFSGTSTWGSHFFWGGPGGVR